MAILLSTMSFLTAFAQNIETNDNLVSSVGLVEAYSIKQKATPYLRTSNSGAHCGIYSLAGALRSIDVDYDQSIAG